MKLAFLLLALAIAGDQGVGEARKDRDRMQGTWTVIVCRHGRTTLPSSNGEHTLTFKGAKVISTWNGMRARKAASFKLGGTKTPREFDFTDKEAPFKGIYEFEGRRLRICYNREERPRRLDAEERDEEPYNFLYELERKPGANRRAD